MERHKIVELLHPMITSLVHEKNHNILFGISDHRFFVTELLPILTEMTVQFPALVLNRDNKRLYWKHTGNYIQFQTLNLEKLKGCEYNEVWVNEKAVIPQKIWDELNRIQERTDVRNDDSA